MTYSAIPLGIPDEAWALIGLVGSAQAAARRGGRRVQKVIAQSVVLAFELDEFLAAGMGPRQAQGVHRRLGAAVRQAHLVQPGHAGEPFRQLDFHHGREGEDRPGVADRLRHSIGHRRITMAEHDRAEPHAIVDVALAVAVP